MSRRLFSILPTGMTLRRPAALAGHTLEWTSRFQAMLHSSFLLLIPLVIRKRPRQRTILSTSVLLRSHFEHKDPMTSSPRQAAFHTLLRIDKERSYADILIDQELKEGGLAGPDR